MRSYHQKTQTTIISEKREQRGNCIYCSNNMTSQTWLLPLNKHSHTWYRRSSDHSSRIDMIFSSIPMNNLRFETTFTTFDHLFVNATFGQVRPRVEPTMKDHILGSDEYLIRAQDTILQHLERFGNGPLQPIDDNQPDNDQENSYKHADENLAVHDIHNGRTTLHVFNSIIKELQGIHNEISSFFLTRSFLLIKKSYGNFCNKPHNWYNNIQNLQISSSE
jgi:hypothetical protein